MPDDPQKPGELDDLESVLDRFLERRLFGAVGPRYRSIALVGTLVMSIYAATRRCPEPSAPSSASSGSIAASASPTPAPMWAVPGLR